MTQQWQPWMDLERDWLYYAARLIVWGPLLGAAVWLAGALLGAWP